MSGRVYARKFDWDEARRLRSQGWTLVEIARKFGVSPRAVGYAVNDEILARMRAYHAEYQRGGTCVDCGAEISHNASRPVSRCVRCSAIRLGTSARDGELFCFRCKEWKPDDAFPRSRSEKFARRERHTLCRSCQTEAKREYRKRNRERERAYERAYRTRHRAEARARAAEEAAKPAKETTSSDASPQ